MSFNAIDARDIDAGMRLICHGLIGVLEKLFQDNTTNEMAPAVIVN